MKFPELNSENKVEINRDKANADIDKSLRPSSDNKENFERLFYNIIDVFSYSKFFNILIESHENPDSEYIHYVKSFYNRFIIDNKKNLTLLGKETYLNLGIIIDQYCEEKFRSFFYQDNSPNQKLKIDKKIDEFLDTNNQSIALIKSYGIKNPDCKNLEEIINDLRRNDPVKFSELMNFEIDRIKLKKSHENLSYMIGDMKNTSSKDFFIKIKKFSRLDSSKASCSIS